MSKENRPTLTIDVEYYQKFLDDSDLTEEQKEELITTLWSVVSDFVMIGWNVHPVQQAQQNCGQEDKTTLPTTHNDSYAIESKPQTIVEQFIAACDVKQEGDKIDA